MDPKTKAKMRILQQQMKPIPGCSSASSSRKRRFSESKVIGETFGANKAYPGMDMKRRESYPPVAVKTEVGSTVYVKTEVCSTVSVKTEVNSTVAVKTEASTVSVKIEPGSENLLQEEHSKLEWKLEKAVQSVKASKNVARKTQLVPAAIGPRPYNKRRRSSGVRDDGNDVGYRPRFAHRHSWQAKRQEEFMAYVQGAKYDPDSD